MEKNIIKESIDKLSLSYKFKKMAKVNGFETIEEILSFPATFLLQHKGVDYHLYKELADYLKDNNFLHLLKHE